MKIVAGFLLSFLPVVRGFTDVQLLKDLNREELVDNLLTVTDGTPSTTFDCATHGTIVNGCCMEALELGCFYHEIYFWHHEKHYEAGYNVESGEFWKDHQLSSQAEFPGWRYKDYYAWLKYRESVHYKRDKTVFEDFDAPGTNFKEFNDWSSNTAQHDDGTGHLDEVCKLFDEYAIACSGRKTMPYDSDPGVHATLGAADYSLEVACPVFAGQDSLRFDVAKSTPLEVSFHGGFELKEDDPNAVTPRLYTMGVISSEKQDMSLSCHCMREIVANNPGVYTVPETSRCYDVVTKSACERQPCGDGGYCQEAADPNNDYLKITAPWSMKSYKFDYKRHFYQVDGTWFDWPQQSRVFRYWDSYDVATRSSLVPMDLQRTCSCYPGWDKTPYNAETNAMEMCNIDRAYCPPVGKVHWQYSEFLQQLPCDNGFYQTCDQNPVIGSWKQLQAPDDWEIIIMGVPEMRYYPKTENNDDHGEVNEWGIKCLAQVDASWGVATEFYDDGNGNDAPRIQTGNCVEQNTSYACTCWSRDKLASISSAYYDNLPMTTFTELKERSLPETSSDKLNVPHNIYAAFGEGGVCGPVTVNETQCANYYKYGIKEFRTTVASLNDYVSNDVFKCGQLLGVSTDDLEDSTRKDSIKQYDGSYNINNEESNCFEVCRHVVETANGCRWIDGTPIHEISSVALHIESNFGQSYHWAQKYYGADWYSSHAIAVAQGQAKGAGGAYCNSPTVPCGPTSCVDPHGNTGICTNGDGMYTCACQPGWTNESLCQESVDDCASNPCKNGGVCTDGHQEFTCDCTGTGYSGPTCEVNIDECAGASNPCLPGGLCEDTDGSYECGCYDDYAGDNCDVIIDDCNGIDCGHGSCQDLNTTYQCNCAYGWQKDNPGNRPGHCTVDVDECEPNGGLGDCDINAICTNLDGSHSCDCKSGWRGSGLNCSDVNECEETGSLQHDCHAYADCTNTDGGFTCQCWDNTFTDESPEGQQGKECVNINECPAGTNTHNCHAHATCEDATPPTKTDPGWYCTCNAGWSGDGENCADIDECESNDGKGDCQNGKCWDSLSNDTIGYDTRVCECEPGYITNYDGSCAVDVDECTAKNGSALCGKGDCYESSTDSSILPNNFECNCYAGWSKTEDKGFCTVEINECVETTPTVPELCVAENTESCTDLENGRICNCKPGWEGDRCEKSIDDCLRTNDGADLADGGVPCKEGDIGCANPCKHNSPCTDLHLDFSCDCDHETAGTDIGWEGKQCDDSINNCLEDPCCDSSTQKWCTETTAVTGAICSDGFTDNNGIFNHNHRTCDCSNTNPPMYGDSCQKLVVQGCMDDEKINYDPDANHDDYGKCEEGDDVYDLDGFKDRHVRMSKWKAMQERKYKKIRTDGKDYSDKSKRKEIRKADRIAIKQEDYLPSSWSKLSAIGFGNRPKRLEVGTKNKDEPENCLSKVAGGDFVGASDDCVTTVLDEEDGEGDSKTLTRRALPDEVGSWQVVGKTIDGTVKPVIKQERTGPDAYTMWCWEDNTWTQETPNLSEGADYLCSKTRHRVLVGSVTDYPAPCDLSGCTSEQKTNAYRNREIGDACDGEVQDADRDFNPEETDTATCKTLGCTTHQIVDSFYFVDECPNPNPPADSSAGSDSPPPEPEPEPGYSIEFVNPTSAHNHCHQTCQDAGYTALSYEQCTLAYLAGATNHPAQAHNLATNDKLTASGYWGTKSGNTDLTVTSEIVMNRAGGCNMGESVIGWNPNIDNSNLAAHVWCICQQIT